MCTGGGGNVFLPLPSFSPVFTIGNIANLERNVFLPLPSFSPVFTMRKGESFTSASFLRTMVFSKPCLRLPNQYLKMLACFYHYLQTLRSLTTSQMREKTSTQMENMKFCKCYLNYDYKTFENRPAHNYCP